MRELCPKCNSSTALGDIRCFKCGYRQQRFVSYDKNYDLKSIELPIPEGIIYNPNNFHSEAIEWLTKAYIFNNMIIEQGIGYCSHEHKVFIPAYSSEGELKFYQLRTLDPDIVSKCKYLTYGKSSEYLIKYSDHKKSNKIVIVEDHLSAIRIRKFSNVCALSGTFLSSENCNALLQQYRVFIFWLDPDQPGRQALIKNFKRLKQHANNITVKCLFIGGLEPKYSFYNVNYDKITEDPKYFRDSEISKIINNEVILCGTLVETCAKESK